MSNPETNPTNTSGDIEISLAEIIVFLKIHFRLILICGIVSGIIGAIYALSLQKEFTSSTQIMPELQSGSALSKMGGFSALAGLAGFDLSQMSGTDAVRPDLYPSIVQTLPFALFMFEQKVYVSEYKKTMRLSDYFDQKNESWFGKLLNSDNKVNISPPLDPQKLSKSYELTKAQADLVKSLHERILATFDRKSGVITIHTKMPDPVVAATTAQAAVEYLKEYVTSYRTDKARKQVKFLSGQVAEAKRRYQNSEAALATYRDRNRFLYAESAKVEEQRLQADFMLAQNVYNNLAQQHEQAKIRVEEETPVFKTLDPSVIPLKRSEPKRTIIVLVFSALGSLLSALVIFVKQKRENSF